ncbi:MFS transporter [Ponticaulis profundi]|uniref:MFS transporter n=1 Tax=Ponticaulis profundi TaxID=2665222 RepID=A0ABW1S9W0_9PROT
MNTYDEAKNETLTAGAMVRYGIGQTGAQIFRDTPAALLPVFMTTMLGIPAWIAGLVILIPKLWVICCDPLMGAWSDRAAPHVGRTPFLVTGALATALGFLILFSFTDFPSVTIAALWMGVMFALSMTAFSAFSVPYLAVAAELTPDTHERTKLLVFRMIFLTFGVILGVGLAQPMVFWFGGGAAGWFKMALVFTAICGGTMLASALLLRPLLKGTHANDAEIPTFRSQLAAAAQNKPFRILLGVHMLQNIGQSVGYTVIAFVFIYLAENIALLPSFVLAMSIIGLSAQPLWPGLSRKLGKQGLFAILTLGWCLVTISWLFIDLGENISMTLPLLGQITGKDFLILVRGALIGVTNSGFVLLITSLFTDTVHVGPRSGKAAVEGGYAGVWSAVEKLAFALGPMVAGIVLSVAGFQSSKTGVVAQTDGALLGITIAYSLVPISFFLLSLTLMPAFNRAMKQAEGPVTS